VPRRTVNAGHPDHSRGDRPPDDARPSLAADPRAIVTVGKPPSASTPQVRPPRGKASSTPEVSALEWEPFLTSLGLNDVYMSRGYLRASSIPDGGDAKLLAFERPTGTVAFPLLIRAIPGATDFFDITSPHGYGGPVGVGPNPPWDGFWNSYDRWCLENRVVTSFIRFHPLYGNQRSAHPSMTLVPLAGTVGWRTESGRDLLGEMHRHHRRSVRRALRRGLTVRLSELDDEGLTRFRVLYSVTMRRIGAADYYAFPDSYWQNLRAGLGRQIVLGEVVSEGGQVLAAAIVFLASRWAHYHLGASSDEGRREGAMALLLFELARSAQARGFGLFHLGGGVGGESDSLLLFKRRFDPGGLLPAALGKQIHNKDAYRRLSGVTSTAGYFPRYRAQGRT
jgi:serine/alanine adding enzyme